jgi:hypothetical protein
MNRLKLGLLASLFACGVHYTLGNEKQDLAPTGWCQTSADCPTGDFCAQGLWLCPAPPECGDAGGPCAPYCGACVAQADSGNVGPGSDAGNCPALINCNSLGACQCNDGVIEACPTNSCDAVCCGHGGAVFDGGNPTEPAPGFCATNADCDGGMMCAQGEWLCPAPPNCQPAGMCSPFCGVCVP